MVSDIVREHKREATDASGKIHSVDYVELRGLSADEKPTDYIFNGSIFIEMDTHKVFFFDESSGTWL